VLLLRSVGSVPRVLSGNRERMPSGRGQNCQGGSRCSTPVVTKGSPILKDRDGCPPRQRVGETPLSRAGCRTNRWARGFRAILAGRPFHQWIANQRPPRSAAGLARGSSNPNQSIDFRREVEDRAILGRQQTAEGGGKRESSRAFCHSKTVLICERRT